jgi:hypothetical protein
MDLARFISLFLTGDIGWHEREARCNRFLFHSHILYSEVDYYLLMQ